MAEFPVRPGRAALVIVDMQNCFVADSPVAAQLGKQVAGRLNQLAAACRQSGIPVIWTRHVVRPDGSNTGLLGELIPPVAAGIINEDAPTSALHPLMDVRPADTTACGAAAREFRAVFLSDGPANFDLPDGGQGAASAAELQRTTCAVMAFDFAEVTSVDEALSRIPAAVTA
jgi:nicotinamidase-related amidase